MDYKQEYKRLMKQQEKEEKINNAIIILGVGTLVAIGSYVTGCHLGWERCKENYNIK